MQDIFSLRLQQLEDPYGIPVVPKNQNAVPRKKSSRLDEPSYAKYMKTQDDLKRVLANRICIDIIPGECNNDENIDNIDIDMLLKALAECMNTYFDKYKADEFCRLLQTLMEEIFKKSSRISLLNTSNHTIELIKDSFSDSDKIFLKKSFINICIYLMKIFDDLGDITNNIADKEKEKDNLLKYISSKFEYKITHYRPFKEINYILREFQFSSYSFRNSVNNYNNRNNETDRKNENDRKKIMICATMCKYNPEYTIERLLLLLQLLKDNKITLDAFCIAIQLPDYIPRASLYRASLSGGGKSRRNRTRKNNSRRKKNKKTLKK